MQMILPIRLHQRSVYIERTYQQRSDPIEHDELTQRRHENGSW